MGNGMTALVVAGEDDIGQSSLTSIALRRAGYDVTTASPEDVPGERFDVGIIFPSGIDVLAMMDRVDADETRVYREAAGTLAGII